MVRTKNNRLIMRSKCPVWGTNSIVKCFVLNAIPWVYKMNEIVNKFLLVGDKSMPEMHLKQSGFTYSACGPFTKNKQRIEKFMKTGNTDFTYKNELDKACFQHDVAYGKTRNLVKRTQSDKVLKEKAFKIASDPKYGYQRRLTSMVYKFFDEKSASLNKSSGSGIVNKPNYQLANELHRIDQLLKNSKKEKSIHILETIFVVLI